MSVDLKLNRISKRYGTTRVLQDVSLDVAPGEFVSLVGASGCGKSTLLRIIAGLETEDAGSIEIGGRPVGHLGPRARNIAMVFQNYALYPHMTVAGNVGLPLRMSGLNWFERLPMLGLLSRRRKVVEAEITQRVGSVASQLAIDHLLHRKPGQLSGGQRQRVALARALVREPSVFLMDEPLSNLEAQLRVHMRDEISELHRRIGTTFIYVTHDQIEAMTMSDRIAMVEPGRSAQIGTPADLYERPATLSVARFIGSPEINVIPVNVGPDGRLDHQGHDLGLFSDAENGTASLGLRPEHLRFVAVRDQAELIARVRRFEHHGADRLVHADLQSPAGGTVTSRVPAAEADLSPGSFVSIAFDADKVHAFDKEGRRATVAAAGETAARPRLVVSAAAAS